MQPNFDNAETDEAAYLSDGYELTGRDAGRLTEAAFTLRHFAPGSMTEHQYGQDNEYWLPACPFCRALSELDSRPEEDA